MPAKTYQHRFKVSAQSAQNLLGILGVQTRIQGDRIFGCCPIHHGDNATAFSYRNSQWVCFTHGCQSEYGNDIVGLIAGIKRVSKDEAEGWIVEHIDEVPEGMKTNLPKPEIIYPEWCLERLLKTDYYEKKGFSAETCKKFTHGLAQSNKMRGRVVFPIRNEKGFIVGFSGRWAGKEAIINGKLECLSATGKPVRKWLHTSFPKGKLLFNYNEAKPFSDREIIVVESIGNVMRWHDAGFKNVVATLGTHISDFQIQLLTSSPRSAILAYDGDEAGRTASAKTRKKLEAYINCLEIFPPDGKDWSDITNEQTRFIYEAARGK